MLPPVEPPHTRLVAVLPRVLVPVPRGGPPAARRPARNTGRRWYRFRLLALLTLLSLVTALPSFTTTLWNPDEGFLATQARQLGAGGVLYESVVDRKPPLLPWLYRGVFAVFGDGSLWPLKAAAVVATVATAAVVASIARRRWGERAGWTAGVLAVLLSVGLDPEDTQAATFEVFMLPWTAAALWCADRRHWAGAGLAVALATLTKQTGGAVLLPVLFLLARSHAGGVALVRTLAAYALPLGATALVFGPGRFVYWTVTGSGSYASVEGAELLALMRASGNAALLALACAPLLVALFRVTRVARRACARERSDHFWGWRSGDGREVTDLWVWLAASGVAVCAGFQFYGHYYLQLVPPLALLATVVLRELRPRQATAAFGLTAVLAAGFTGWGFVADRPELEHAKKVAAELKQRTAPADPVLVWGMHPEGYWLADRTPASRYLTAGFLTNYSGGRGGVRVGERYAMPGAWRRFLHDLAVRPPQVVVDDSRGKPYRPARIPTLRRYLTAHYERAGVVDGAVFYVRSRGG